MIHRMRTCHNLRGRGRRTRFSLTHAIAVLQSFESEGLKIKTRNGFVSNSSSSSFVIIGLNLTGKVKLADQEQYDEDRQELAGLRFSLAKAKVAARTKVPPISPYPWTRSISSMTR